MRAYTVIGLYKDNEQPWMVHVQAGNPRGAAAAGVESMLATNEWDRDQAENMSVVEVVAGERPGLLGNQKILDGDDLLEQSQSHRAKNWRPE